MLLATTIQVQALFAVASVLTLFVVSACLKLERGGGGVYGERRRGDGFAFGSIGSLCAVSCFLGVGATDGNARDATHETDLPPPTEEC